MYDLLIKNGFVIDPEGTCEKVSPIAVSNGHIVAFEDGIEAKTVIDAQDCIVTPGLIDFHAHIFERGTDSGINPDLAMLPLGVTTVIDVGSSGASTYRSFIDRLNQCRIKTKLYLHVSPTGQVTHQYPESVNPEKWNYERFDEAFEKYSERILGFKIRISKNVFGEDGLYYLEKALELSERYHRNLVVHVTDPPVPQSRIASMLRTGDVFCHVYHGRGYTILENQSIPPAIWNARKRGVIFDCCHGSINFNFNIAEEALREGFPPDTISSDMNSVTWNRAPLFNLPMVLSKFMMMGMTLKDIIKRVTTIPAKLIGEEGNLGTLRPGSVADIAIFKIRNNTITFVDSEGNKRQGSQYLHPVASILDGTIVYRDQEICF